MEAFGESEPVATVPGQAAHVIELGVGGDGHAVVAGNDLPGQLVLQLQHHLGPDGPPALGGIFSPAELGPQGGAQAGDDVVHHPESPRPTGCEGKEVLQLL